MHVKSCICCVWWLVPFMVHTHSNQHFLLRLTRMRERVCGCCGFACIWAAHAAPKHTRNTALTHPKLWRHPCCVCRTLSSSILLAYLWFAEVVTLPLGSELGLMIHMALLQSMMPYPLLLFVHTSYKLGTVGLWALNKPCCASLKLLPSRCG